MQLAKFFKIRYVPAGQRVYVNTDKIDSFNLILKGRMGIYYPDLNKIKICSNPITRIMYLNEAEAKKRRERKMKTFMS